MKINRSNFAKEFLNILFVNCNIQGAREILQIESE